MIEYLNRLFGELEDEDGQTMAEYAVVLGVITIAVVGRADSPFRHHLETFLRASSSAM